MGSWWSDFIHKPEAVAALAAAIIAAGVSVWNFFASNRQQKALEKSQAESAKTQSDVQAKMQQDLAQFQTDLQAKMETGLGAFKDTLERHRIYDVFQRERINSHIEKAITAFNEIYGLGDLLAVKSWIESPKLLDAHEEFRRAWRRLDTHRAALRAFGATSEAFDREFTGAIGRVGTLWDETMGEIARKNPSNLNPGSRGYSEAELFKSWHKLMDHLCVLRDMTAKLSAETKLPQ